MLVVAVVLFWPWRGDWGGAVVVPALSPFVGGCSVLATRVVGLVALFAIPVLVLSTIWRRWFCRHACPTGFLLELLGRRGSSGWRRWPAVGKWLAVLGVCGAGLGFPVFLWMDPLAFFGGFMNSWRHPLVLANVVAGLGLPALVVFNLLFPRVWCQRICPLGATQEWLRWAGLLSERRLAGALVVEQRRAWRMGRRRFLGGCAGVAGVVAFEFARGREVPLRPPGAQDEARFSGVCVRCGNCAQACPTKVIQPDFGASGLHGVLSPVLRFAEGYCHEDCSRCGQVCPTGALAPLTLERKQAWVIGRADVDLENCWSANGRECTACIRGCPYAAIEMHSEDGGFVNEPRVDASKCNGCGACESVCPVRPERAIRVLTGGYRGAGLHPGARRPEKTV